jgi:hypothetical protein
MTMSSRFIYSPTRRDPCSRSGDGRC